MQVIWIWRSQIVCTAIEVETGLASKEGGRYERKRLGADLLGGMRCCGDGGERVGDLAPTGPIHRACRGRCAHALGWGNLQRSEPCAWRLCRLRGPGAFRLGDSGMARGRRAEPVSVHRSAG